MVRLVWRQLDEVPSEFGRAVVTIGNFDGVHLGHRVTLDRARAVADTFGPDVALVVVSFDPHPMAVLAPGREPAVLTTIDQRVELLVAAGADHVLVLPFTRELASWPPDEFVQRVLVDALHAVAVVVGANFRFGHRAAGDVDTLRARGTSDGFVVDAVELVGGERPWSSTAVREALARGDVVAAAGVLGRPHTVEGVVVEGDHRGRELGYPTANVPTSGMRAVPADGVYAGWLRRLDDPEAPQWPAAISVGTNPTFAGTDRRVESYVLDRDDLELYEVPVRVSFHQQLRGQVRFDGVDDLVRQMAVDVDRTRELLTHREGQQRPAAPAG
ncbi:MAG: bifunctional riboflavin kinase/FAD synthetase [Nocardioidaceae bacterium]|nr:bifunctional riboflavin kinase/FAD synthetase [Nocardioidaceae bacterium]